MFDLQLVSTSMDWHKLDFILTIVISTIAAGFTVWRILKSSINKKANKSDLTKLEKDMSAKYESLERRNEKDHTTLRIIITEHFDTRIDDLKEFMIQLVKKK